MKEFKKLTLEEICKLEYHPLANLFPLLSAQAAAAFIITKNIMRRNLDEDQRAMIAAKLYAKLPNKPQHGGDRKSSASLLGSELDSAQSAINLKAGVCQSDEG